MYIVGLYGNYTVCIEGQPMALLQITLKIKNK